MPTKLQLRCISLMGKTVKTINNILATVSQRDATTYRDLNDGDDGWTVLEVLCHLVDYDKVVQERITLMIEQDNPRLPFWDHTALVNANAYNQQSLAAMLSKLLASRAALVERFTLLTDDEWNRTAIHAEYGAYSMSNVVVQVGWHDANHLEQMSRILNQRW